MSFSTTCILSVYRVYKRQLGGQICMTSICWVNNLWNLTSKQLYDSFQNCYKRLHLVKNLKFPIFLARKTSNQPLYKGNLGNKYAYMYISISRKISQNSSQSSPTTSNNFLKSKSSTCHPTFSSILQKTLLLWENKGRKFTSGLIGPQ